MFIATLFIIAKTWKQTKMSFSRLMDKLWYIQKMKYSERKRYELLPTLEEMIIM